MARVGRGAGLGGAVPRLERAGDRRVLRAEHRGRRVDEQNRVLDIVDNFEKISFNVGPTLLAWLERHRPDVYGKILEADRTSVAARGATATPRRRSTTT